MPRESQDQYVMDVRCVTCAFYIYQVLNTILYSAHSSALPRGMIPCIHYHIMFALLPECS